MRKRLLVAVAAVAVLVVIVVSIIFIPQTNVSQRWSFQTTGSVHDPPVTDNGYVYVNSYLMQSDRGGVFCLNDTTGSQVWDYPLTLPYSLTVSNGNVYFANLEGYLFCFNAATGSQIWNFTTGTYITNPALSGSHLYAGSGNNVFALNPANGEVMWNQSIGVLTTALGSLLGAGGYPTIQAGLLYLTFDNNTDSSAGNGIVALNAATGAKLWENVLPVEIASLAISHGHAIVGAYSTNNQGAGNMSYTGSIYAFDAVTGNREWNRTIGTYKGDAVLAMSMIADNSIIVGYGNKTSAFNPLNGNKLWSFVNDGSVGAIALAQPFLYVTSGPNVYCLSANSGNKVWSFNVGDQTASGPYFADGQVYVGSVGDQYFAPSIYNTVYALDATTGIETWRFTVEGNPDSFALVHGVLYVGTTYTTTGKPDNEGNGTVYALESGTLPTLLLRFAIVGIIVALIILTAILLLVFKPKESPTTSESKGSIDSLTAKTKG